MHFFPHYETPRNETVCEHEGLLRVFRYYAIYQRPSSKNFSIKFQIFSSIFPQFFERFSVQKDVFLLFPVGESLMCIPLGIFLRCKIDERLTIVSFCIFKNLYFFEP